MANRNYKVKLILLGLTLSYATCLKGQINTLDYIYGGLDDAEVILQEYLKPFANILGSDLNGGWYNTARPHQLGGLDLMMTVSWAKAPESLISYDMADLALNGNLEPTGTTIAPTIIGDQEERPELYYTETVDIMGTPQEIEYARYTHPNGVGYNFFPLPMAQLTVGLPFGTDASVRFVPMINLGKYGEIGLWGVGGKHSVSQWIPGLKDLELLDISLQGGYTKVTTAGHLDIQPLPVDVDPDPDHRWDNQYLYQVASGWTANLIASQTILLFTFYQGIGYSSSNVDMRMEGDYPVHSVILEGADIGSTTYEIVEDPISLNFVNSNNLRINIGARVKLGFLTLHYDFSHTLYSSHTVGLGITFR